MWYKIYTITTNTLLDFWCWHIVTVLFFELTIVCLCASFPYFTDSIWQMSLFYLSYWSQSSHALSAQAPSRLWLTLQELEAKTIAITTVNFNQNNSTNHSQKTATWVNVGCYDHLDIAKGFILCYLLQGQRKILDLLLSGKGVVSGAWCCFYHSFLSSIAWSSLRMCNSSSCVFTEAIH